MTTLAVLFMSCAVFFVVFLAAWCYYQVLVHPGENSDSAPPDLKNHGDEAPPPDGVV